MYKIKKMKRKHGGVVVSELETTEYKIVFEKRRLMGNMVIYLMGVIDLL